MCLATEGDVTEASSYARDTLLDLSEAERLGIIAGRAPQLVAAMPSATRTLPPVRELNDLLMLPPGQEESSSVPVVVAPAEPQHVEALAVLLEEMDRHYGTTEFEPFEQRVAQIRDALFGEVAAACALLAWDEADLVGVASYSFLWPAAGVTRSLYLKELYVAQRWQRQGVGKLLMDSLVAVAGKHGCSRVEWTTDRESEGAQRL